MIRSPIEASIPSTTEAGKIALNRAALNLARIDLDEARQADGDQKERIADLRGLPLPRRIIDASSAGARPAAGPLMVT